MNILFVNDIPFNPIAGGIERVTDALAKELVKRGHAVYYLCEKVGPIRTSLLEYSFPVPLYQFPYVGRTNNKENINYYRNLLLELKVDIVVNQRGLAGGYNDLLPITSAKIISVIHSVPNAYVIRELANIIKSTKPPFIHLKKIIKIFLYPIMYYYWKNRWLNETKKAYLELSRYSDVIVTLSDADARIMQDMLNTDDKHKVIHIPNPNTFDDSSIGVNAKDNILLFVGRLTKLEKAPHRLLKIWTYLHKKHTDWKLVIVGDGEEKDAMISYVRRKGLINVFFEGKQLDVASYYKKAAFVCLTSNFEGWGMALTEGMQYGCIPFTFDNYGAASEIIDNGLNGCLIHSFDIKQYAERLSMLMSDDSRRAEMSLAAFEKVKEFSVENVVMRWDKLFQSLYDHP